jgi:hypothetical protein
MPTNADNAAACAGCGASFVCGARTGAAECWCAQLAALTPVPGRGCLCRACLERALAQAEKREA